MVELVTEQGWRFWSSACVTIRGKVYDLDEMNERQKLFVSGKLQEQFLNSAFAGKATFHAEDLPPLEEVFPDDPS